MKHLSPAELEKLQRSAQMKMLKKNIAMQESRQKELQSLSSSIPYNKKMKRLQVRSFPLGCDIILDSVHTNETTPHTFEDLDAGEHEIEMHYVEPETEEVKVKKEKVIIREGKRVVCKLYFKEPKTLA